MPFSSPRSAISRALAAATLVLTGLASSAQANDITWEDLLPPALTELDLRASKMHEELLQLDDRKREAFTRVARQLQVEHRLAAGDTEADLSDAERELLESNPKADTPEALAYWQEYKSLYEQIEAANNSLSPEMDGKDVRLPGYLLPLEMEGKTVREFLLVPYVGACIHTPPPPPNQMVFVETPDGYEPEGLYEPVWVEGKMRNEPGSHRLSYIDGEADIDAGYSLRANNVEPYEY